MSSDSGLAAKPVVGYYDPWSVAPGDPTDFMISTSDPWFTTELVRRRHGDPHPAGPGSRYVPVPNVVDAGPHPGINQPLRPGSFMTTPASRLDLSEGFTLLA